MQPRANIRARTSPRAGGVLPNPTLAQEAWLPGLPLAPPLPQRPPLTPAQPDEDTEQDGPAEAGLCREEILARRRQHVGPNVALFFDEPLHIVRGAGCELFDPEGRSYLDCINNVSHVGHCHPTVGRQGGQPGCGAAARCGLPAACAAPERVCRAGRRAATWRCPASRPAALRAQVAAAISRQLFTLNTNCRYLHEGLSTYAEVLASTMPSPLEVRCAGAL